jgi:hypothetical protein
LLQAALHRKFGFGSKAPGLWGGALERLVTLTSDPDTETATWPRLGTPLGIVEPIRPSNIFLLLADDDVEHAAPYEDLALEGAWANYKSYDENREEAEALFDIELEKGFVEWSPNLASLEAKYGRLIPLAIGFVVKQKLGAKKKVRLVHDLRRSLVNEQIACPERLILPRLRMLFQTSLICWSARNSMNMYCWSHWTFRMLSNIYKSGIQKSDFWRVRQRVASLFTTLFYLE